MYLIIHLYIPEYKIWQFSYFLIQKKNKNTISKQVHVPDFLPSILKCLFALLVTGKYRWLEDILFCAALYSLCLYLHSFLFLPCPPLFKQIWFSLLFCENQKWTELYIICDALKICLSLTSFMQKLSPSKLHTSPNLLHWILNCLELFPWEKWNAEYKKAVVCW